MTIEEAAELFKDVPDFRYRAMFGGYGLYTGDRIFALVDDGDVYLKGDEVSSPMYEEDGGEQFSYMSKNGLMTMKYWRFADRDVLVSHLPDALDTVARAPAPKPKKSKRK